MTSFFFSPEEPTILAKSSPGRSDGGTAVLLCPSLFNKGVFLVCRWLFRKERPSCWTGSWQLFRRLWKTTKVVRTLHLTLRKTRYIVMLHVDCVWNVVAHAQKPDFVFRRNGTSPFKSAGGRQFSRLLAAEVCASAVVMLDTPCSEVVWRVLATHSTRQFPLHFPSLASPCAITFQLDTLRHDMFPVIAMAGPFGLCPVWGRHSANS